MKLSVKLKENILRELNVAAGLSEVLYKSRKNVELVFRIAKDDPKMQQLILDFIGGVGSYSQIRRNMIRRMLSRHPLKTLRLGL
ncbi:MAG: hypothetical protein ACFFB7_02915 [Candidatus Sifarchaeia archaeon]